MRKRRREKIKFKIEKVPVRGVVGLILSILVVACTAVIVLYSAKNGGEIRKLVALAAMLVNLTAFVGFAIACKALFSRDVRPLVPIIAMVLNGITIIFYLFIYILGF